MTTREDLFPALARAGLMPALAALESLAGAQEQGDPRRHERLSDEELLTHADGHLLEVAQDITRRDDQTGHPSAAHLAVRSVMVLARALERHR